jgi:ATP-dependent Lon protease
MTLNLAESYPVLPLRDIVVFPHMIVPLFVGRDKSVRALEQVMTQDKQILLSSQRDPGGMIRLKMGFFGLVFWPMSFSC